MNNLKEKAKVAGFIAILVVSIPVLLHQLHTAILDLEVKMAKDKLDHYNNSVAICMMDDKMTLPDCKHVVEYILKRFGE